MMLWPTAGNPPHVGHVLCKQCAVPPPPIFTFVYSLVFLQALLTQKKASTNWKRRNHSTTVRMICRNNDLLSREILPRMKSVKTAPNARVVIFGKAQTDEDGII